MMIKNALSLWVVAVGCATASATLRARNLSDGHLDDECGSYKACFLVNLETNAEYQLPEGTVLSYNPDEGNRWSIRCEVTGKIDFVKFFRNGNKVSDQYSVPAWWRGDNHGTWVNHDVNLKVCGKKNILVSFHTWRGMDKFPCSVKNFAIEPTGCVIPTKAPTEAPVPAVPAPTKAPVPDPTEAPVPAPTEAPVPAPTEAPVPAPTEAPVPAPTEAPVPAPTEAPVPAPTEAPVPAPTEAPVPAPTEAPVPPPTKAPIPAPTQAPLEITTKSTPVCDAAKLPKSPACTLRGNQLCYEYPAKAGWSVEAMFHAGDSTFFEMPITQVGAKCITVNSNNFKQKSFWMRFADSCGASDWTYCTNYAVYNPNNPTPTKAPTRFIAPQTAGPVAPSVCQLPPVSPQCYLWGSKLSYGLDNLPSTTTVEVITSSGVEFSWPAVPGETHLQVTFMDFVRKNFKLRFRNACGVSEYKACKNYTPIALDVDRNGVVEHQTGFFQIDINGDGELNDLQEWFGSKEGILLNMDHGVVDGMISGHHLFGDQGGAYTDGFHKLDTHDDNDDQYVSGEELAGFGIWIDENSNARLDNGELFSLEHFKIVALSTQHKGFVSEAILEDGSSMKMEDLWFNR